MTMDEMKFKRSWAEFTISDYQQYSEIKNDQLDDTDKAIRLLSFLSGQDPKEFHQFTLLELFEKLNSLSYLADKPIGTVKPIYQLAGRKYKLTDQIEQLTSGQYIDLEQLLSDPDKLDENIHNIIAILLIPCKEKTTAQRLTEKLGLKKWNNLESYMETPLKETAEIVFNNMSIADAYAISVFFCMLSKKFIRITQDYLLQVMKKKLTSLSTMLQSSRKSKSLMKEMKRIQEKMTLIENGVGLFASTV
jgi:hypothetical protein